MRILFTYQDTRDNQEDIALTPYLFGTNTKVKNSRIIGIGICWIYFAFHIGLGFNLPKGFPIYRKSSKRNT